MDCDPGASFSYLPEADIGEKTFLPQINANKRKYELGLIVGVISTSGRDLKRPV